MLVCYVLFLAVTAQGYGYEKGAIFYHSSKGDIIYGRTADLVIPCSVIKAVFGELKSGHAGLYIGDGKIIHAVREGVIETTSENFIPQDDLSAGAKFMGAKVPMDYDDKAKWPAERKDQLILVAKEQVGKWYDLTFHKQTGPDSGDFTCVGLVEYVYEKAGYDITPFGYYQGGPGGKTYTQIYNCESTLFQDWEGINTFAEKVQFSRFEHPLDFSAGLAYDGGKYMFFPYTQYLQTTTVPVATDPAIPVSGGSGDSGGSGCFVATAAFGSVLDPHVEVLRNLRDRYLRFSSVGRSFIRFYSAWSPPIARAISESNVLRFIAKAFLIPIIGAGYMVSSVGPWPSFVLFAAFLGGLAAFFMIRKRRFFTAFKGSLPG
jgi:hypothetical protein